MYEGTFDERFPIKFHCSMHQCTNIANFLCIFKEIARDQSGIHTLIKIFRIN